MGSCKNIDQQEATIDEIYFESISRGSIFECHLNSNHVAIEKQGLETYQVQRKMQSKRWKRILQLAEKIKLDSLENIKVPSHLHTSDQAASAKLVITANRQSFTTPTFDDANPPEDLKNLIDYIYAFAGEIEH